MHGILPPEEESGCGRAEWGLKQLSASQAANCSAVDARSKSSGGLLVDSSGLLVDSSGLLVDARVVDTVSRAVVDS